MSLHPTQLTEHQHRRRHGRGFRAVAIAFLVGMAFSTVPTPLYPLYQHSDGFSTFTITIVFAVYTVGVLTSLLLAGHVSDWLGRRRILLIALILELAAAVMFTLGTGLAVLVVARIVTGLGVGMLTATATAHLQELHENHRPSEASTRFEVISTTANIGGLGLGPLVAGILAQWMQQPLLIPYLVFGVLLAIAIILAATAPETVRDAQPRRYRPQRIRTHGDVRQYAAAALAGFVAFSVFGLFTSVAPAFVAQTLHESSPLLAGLTAFAVFGASALAQVLSAGMSRGKLRTAGLIAQTAGAAMIVIAVTGSSFATFVAGGVVAGAGAGMLFKSAVAAIAATAPADARGEAQAGLFLTSYIGLALPPVGVGIATLDVPLSNAIVWFAAVIALMLVVDAALSYAGRSTAPAPDSQA